LLTPDILVGRQILQPKVFRRRLERGRKLFDDKREYLRVFP